MNKSVAFWTIICLGLAISPLPIAPVSAQTPPPVGAWRTSTPASELRSSHTITTLDAPVCHGTDAAPSWCGRVLIVGGSGRSAELYDPVEEVSSPAGETFHKFHSHTATLLTDGRVLVAGGRAGTGAAPEAEIYDPETNSWTPAPPMDQGRSGHTAVRLANGKVLVVGGKTDTDSCCPLVISLLASAEVFDPQGNGGAGKWESVSPLLMRRAHHTATLLSSGKVLVVGGNAALPVFGSTHSAELYDPLEDEWKPVGPLSTSRLSHTATLLEDGRVLVVGGIDSAGAQKALTRVEIYDPELEVWLPGPPIEVARGSHFATLLTGAACQDSEICGHVLVTAGSYWASSMGAPDPSGTAELFDPAGAGGGTWRRASNLVTAGFGNPPAALLPNGEVIVVSYPRYPIPLATVNLVQIFDPSGVAAPLRPQVLGVTPNQGSEGGGDEISVVGVGFSDQATLTIGRAPATVISRSSSKIVAVTPPGAGTVDVVVSNLGSSQPSAIHDAARFAYSSASAPPSIESVSPAAAPTMGGGKVVITGLRLTGVNEVLFGDKVAETGSSTNSEVVVVAPRAHAQGMVPVTLTTPFGTSPPSLEARFFYGSGAWHDAGVTSEDANAVVLDGPSCRSDAQQRPSYCGRVLTISSGTDVKIYDPPTGQWLAGPPMKYSHPGGSMTLLDGLECDRTSPPLYCGKVLVAGSDYPPSPMTELFDPSSTTIVDGVTLPGRWEDGAPMPERRRSYSATFLDGPDCTKAVPPSYCGSVLIAGGTSDWSGNNHASATSVIYDAELNLWRPGPRLDSCSEDSCSARFLHKAVPLPDGRVLVAGGFDRVRSSTAGSVDQGVGTGPCDVNGILGQEIFLVLCGRHALNSAQIFDPAAANGLGAWSSTASMAIRRVGFTATLLRDGKVLVAGGTAQEDGPFGHTEIYDPVTGAWRAASDESMQKERRGHSALLMNDGNVMVTGGTITSSVATSAAEIYDVRTREWRNTSFMAASRSGHVGVLVNPPQCDAATLVTYCGAVLVAGGGVGTAEVYVPAPVVEEVIPDRGTLEGGTPVTIRGSYLGNISSISFGDNTIEREHLEVNTAGTQLTVTSPPATLPGTVHVAAVNPGGTSEQDPLPRHSRFTYVGAPGPVSDLKAEVLSDDSVKLGFSAVGFPNADDDIVVTDYVIKQSRRPITAANFSDAASLCGGVCHFEPADSAQPLKVGSSLTQQVHGLSPGTIYYYAIQAKADNLYGEISDDVEIRTFGDDEVGVASGVVGQVGDLSATANSARELELTFSAADDGKAGGAGRYVIKQASEPITEESFDSATSLCGGVCSFDVVAAGDKVSLAIKDLRASTTYHYAVKALGEVDQQGPMSNVASATTEADTIAPAAVGDLQAEPLSGSEIKLTFSAPASDAGEGPPVSDYVIKQAREPITEATFESAKTLCDDTCRFTPTAAGEQLSLSVTGLESSSTYHYALKAIDEGQNVSGLSNMAFATTSEVTPGKVTSLDARARSMSKVTLSFSAADDGTGEAATSYVIKQSKRAMRSEDGFAKAQTLCDGSCRFEATEIGQSLSLTVTGLDPDTTYHYAVRALDDSGQNMGARSTSVKATTRPDRIDPGKVDDLRAKALSKTAVKLLFSAVASNRSKGPAVTSYIIKQSTSPLKDGVDFKRAHTLCGRICTFDVAKVGARLSLKITELRARTSYYYAIKAVDAGGNKGSGWRSVRVKTR